MFTEVKFRYFFNIVRDVNLYLPEIDGYDFTEHLTRFGDILPIYFDCFLEPCGDGCNCANCGVDCKCENCTCEKCKK